MFVTLSGLGLTSKLSTASMSAANALNLASHRVVLGFSIPQKDCTAYNAVSPAASKLTGDAEGLQTLGFYLLIAAIAALVVFGVSKRMRNKLFEVIGIILAVLTFGGAVVSIAISLSPGASC